jgi:hypothetical protein
MPNSIKYNVAAQTLALKDGNYWIGTGDVEKGPTATTDYWNGITPPVGGYTIYLNKASGGPTIYVAANAEALISLTNQIGSQSFTRLDAALDWYNTQADKMAVNIDYPPIITSGLVTCWDAGFIPSYPGKGTTIYDISGNGNNGTLVNGVGYSASNGGVLTFDGVDDWLYSATPNLSATNYTVMGASRYVGVYNPSSPNHQRMINSPLALTSSNWLMGNWATTTTNYYAEGWVSSVYSGPNDTTWRIYSAIGNIAGDSYSLYVNNSLSSGPNGGGSAGPNGFAVSGYGVGNEASTGEFGFLLAYNRILSVDEMTQNYNAYASRFIGL